MESLVLLFGAPPRGPPEAGLGRCAHEQSGQVRQAAAGRESEEADTRSCQGVVDHDASFKSIVWRVYALDDGHITLRKRG
jgi:hypothetical protein